MDQIDHYMSSAIGEARDMTLEKMINPSFLYPSSW